MRAPWYLRALALAFLICCGCASASKQSIKVDADSASTISRSQEETLTQRVQTGPETITTTVEEWESGVRESNPSVRFGRPMPQPLGQPRSDSLPPTPILVKRTVTVDQRGPSLSESQLDAHTASQGVVKTKLEAKGEEEKSSKPAGLLATLLPLWWLWVGLAVLAGCAGPVLWNFRKSIPYIGPLLP